MLKCPCLKAAHACRYVYLLDQAPSPAALSAIQATGAALLLTLLSLVSKSGTSAPSEPAEGLPEHSKEHGNSSGSADLLNPAMLAGAETGLWTFLANSATISAFQHTPASRGAFLIRLASLPVNKPDSLSEEFYLSAFLWFPVMLQRFS